MFVIGNITQVGAFPQFGLQANCPTENELCEKKRKKQKKHFSLIKSLKYKTLCINKI